MPVNPLHQRRAGILLHPTSLPSGKLDNDVERWLDWMQHCGFSIWQVLPLVSPDHSGSPYQSDSAFAFNPDFLESFAPLTEKDQQTLQAFEKEQSAWIMDYAMFTVLKNHFGQRPWNEWPEQYRKRDSNSLLRFCKKHTQQVETVVWQQYQLHSRWQQIKKTAHSKGIYLFGDMPIFVAYDSADVWANAGQYLLDDELNPTYVAGVPPDYFSEDGQRWGNPQYDWQAMQNDSFAWWHARINHMLQLFDIVRIDHFRGLEACWMIPAEEKTAINGFWQKTPGDKLLEEIQREYPELPIVAEDLGVITPEVRALRDKYDLPGMSILQFAFDAFEDNPHKPINFTEHKAAYTGTHDNNTTTGWFAELEQHEKDFVFEVLQSPHREDVANFLIETILHSKANTAITPLQDILQLGSEARMNTPGLTENNWQWQFHWDQLDENACQHYKQLIKETGRHHE